MRNAPRLAASLAAILLYGVASLLTGCGGDGPGDVESSSVAAGPQGVFIRATVIDESGAPLAGAAVTLSGSAGERLTDANGNILLNVAPGDYVLTITSGSATAVSIPVATGSAGSIELGRIQLASAASGIASGPLVGLGSSNFDCGGYQQRQCTIFDWAYYHGGFGASPCDRGLQCENDISAGKICAFGTGVCGNSTRMDWKGTASRVRHGWANGALAEQRKIARFEMINWTAIIGAHNAFNNAADGYVLPTQGYSMTDQLLMGARALLLDVHHVCGLTCEIRLSHAMYETVLGSEVQIGASPFDRHFGFGLMEIRQWLERNPGEVIVLHMEEYLTDEYADAESRADYAWSFEHFLGPYLLRRSEREQLGRWPTLAEMRLMVPPRQVIVFGGANLPAKDYFFHGSPGEFTNPWAASLPKNFDPVACTVDGTTGDGTYHRFDLFDPGQRFVAIEESRYANGYVDSGVIAGDCSGLQWPFPVGVPCASASAIAACGNAEVLLDFVGDTGDDLVAIGDRFGRLVWSWKPEERGWEKDDHAAVLEAASGRWVAREAIENYVYACGRLREGNPSDWKDKRQLTEWRITQGRGPYAKGGLQCAREFGSEFVFSVPVNGPQNTALRDALAPTEAGVWLAYRDVKAASGEIYWDRDVPCVTGVVARPSEPWPPNHKMAIVQLAVVHRCVQAPLCRITRVTSDDPAATVEDWRVTADMTVELRAERGGSSRDGRTYSVDVECVVDEAGRLNWTAVDVLVPHDQGSN
jgi:hypothetical protein